MRMRIWGHNKMRITRHFSRWSCSFNWSEKRLMQLTQRKRIGHNVQSGFSIRFRIGKVIYNLKKTLSSYWKPLSFVHWPMKKTDMMSKLLMMHWRILWTLCRRKMILIHYTARFELVWDIAVAHLGGLIVLLKIIENDTSSTTKQENYNSMVKIHGIPIHWACWSSQFWISLGQPQIFILFASQSVLKSLDEARSVLD